MERTFGGLEQITDVVEVQAGPERPEIARPELERRLRAAVPTPARKAHPQALVDHLFEGLPGAPHLGFQSRCDIVVETESRTHIAMLAKKHHDVNQREIICRAREPITPRRSRVPVSSGLGRGP